MADPSGRSGRHPQGPLPPSNLLLCRKEQSKDRASESGGGGTSIMENIDNGRREQSETVPSAQTSLENGKDRSVRTVPAGISDNFVLGDFDWRRHCAPPSKTCGGDAGCRPPLPSIKPEFLESAIEFSRKTAHFLALNCMLLRRKTTKRDHQVLWHEPLAAKYEPHEKSLIDNILNEGFRRREARAPAFHRPKHCSDFVLRRRKLFSQSQLTIHVSWP